MALKEKTRPARQTDYNQVMELNNDTYGGLDYLSETYKSFLSNSQCLCLVVELQEQVIGFISMHHLPKDKTIVTIAKRVHREHQGRGVARGLEKRALDAAKIQWPDSILNAWGRIYVPVYEKPETSPHSRIRTRQIWTAIGLWTTYEKSLASMNMYNTHHSQDEVIAPDEDTLMTILASSRMDELIPGHYIIASHYWLPMQQNQQNLSDVFRTHHAFCSMDESHTTCIAFSYGISLRVGSTYRYNMMFYSLQSSRHLSMPHIRKHIMNLLSNANDVEKVAFSFQAPEEVRSEDHLDQLKAMFGQDVHIAWTGDVLTQEKDI